MCVINSTSSTNSTNSTNSISSINSMLKFHTTTLTIDNMRRLNTQTHMRPTRSIMLTTRPRHSKPKRRRRQVTTRRLWIHTPHIVPLPVLLRAKGISSLAHRLVGPILRVDSPNIEPHIVRIQVCVIDQTNWTKLDAYSTHLLAATDSI
mmetsp:Transcript_24961/g.44380  ORF Transcript_24961/g.44380 Transcript_24961/m.44380 type:complete len:149 (+) Transcript_24961:1522-1968(+)